jgi:hypothetical protein
MNDPEELRDITQENSNTGKSYDPFQPLWKVPDLAKYLRCSRRWIWDHLNVRQEQEGSIPHLRIAGSPRFVPHLIVRWAEMGCPPVSEFREMDAREGDPGHRQKSSRKSWSSTHHIGSM